MGKGTKSQSSKKKKKPKSAHTTATIESSGFKVTKPEKEASKVSIARKSSKKQLKKKETTSESGKSGEDKSKDKSKDKPEPAIDLYGTPTYESHSDTASLRALMVDVQFIRLTDVPLEASSGEGAIPSEGSIVGVLVLFHRADLKLLQPRVVLQGGHLGVMTTSMALGQVGLKVKGTSAKKGEKTKIDTELTITRAIDDSLEAKSQLLVKLLLFDEKLYSHLVQVAYPFPFRSSFEPMVIPELAIQTSVTPLPAGQS